MNKHYPYGVIDYESSGLDDLTYPIEIGIALKRSVDSPVESWSSLIQPTPDWTNNGFWNPKSSEIHRITQADLSAAPTPDAVTKEAMQFAGDIPLFFDGGRHDMYWHSRLTKTCPGFNLNIHSVHLLVDMKSYVDAFAELVIEHRAEADAIQNIEIIERLLSNIQ